MMQDGIIRLLVIEDEEFDVRRIKNTIKLSEYNIKICDVVSSGLDAIGLMQEKGDYDVVIMDFQIAGGIMGEQLIKELKKIDSSVQILVVTKMTIQQTDFNFANRLLSAGAYWFCTKYPGDIQKYIYQPTDFVLSIVNAYKNKQLKLEKNRSDNILDRNIKDVLTEKEIIGQTAALQRLREKILKYAPTDANIIIYGESGTGKELIATNIHYRSKRKYDPFIPINCASIPHELMESELFGYEKGSFTGAKGQRSGYFEQANKGTIFLDEISEFPLTAQAKLLRVLQEGEIDKIGRKKSHKVDVRIIAATNRDLKKMVADGKFREDLFYRLNVLRLEAPALRTLREDIPHLVSYYVRRYCFQMGLRYPDIEPEAIEALQNYAWPGNVRQLQNVIQRILLIDESHINQASVIEALGVSREQDPEFKIPIKFNAEQILPLRTIERKFREKYFQFVRNHSKTDSEAAQKLGLAPPNYHRISKELGLK